MLNFFEENIIKGLRKSLLLSLVLKINEDISGYLLPDHCILFTIYLNGVRKNTRSRDLEKKTNDLEDINAPVSNHRVRGKRSRADDTGKTSGTITVQKRRVRNTDHAL